MTTTVNDLGLCSAPWDTTLMDMVDIFPNAAFQYDDSLTASQNAFWDLSCPAVDESLGQDQKTFSDTSQCSDDYSAIVPQRMRSPKAQDNGIDHSELAADVTFSGQAGHETAGSSFNGGDLPSPAVESLSSSSRKRKGSTTSATSVSDHIRHSSSAKSTKANRNRERNRVAAAKCRQKSKKSVSELQRREREMLQQNRFLTAAAGSLREEVLGLKNEILRHSRCDSEVIQKYITKAAQEIG